MYNVTFLMPGQLVAANTATKVVAIKIVTKLTSLWLLLMSLLFAPNQPGVKATSQIAPPSLIRAAARTRPAVKHARSHSDSEIIRRKLYLHSFEKEYTCVFTGKVTCGGVPCRTGSVRLRVASRQNPVLVKTATLLPDGTYELSVLLKEYLHEHVDWSLLADSPDSESKQINGRQILMDESTIKIEEPLELL